MSQALAGFLLVVIAIGGGAVVLGQAANEQSRQPCTPREVPIDVAPTPYRDIGERHWQLYKTASSAMLNPLTAPPRTMEGTWQGTISEARGVRLVCIPLDSVYRVCTIEDMINKDGLRVLGQVRENGGWRTEFVQELRP
jgi:hypothetical protein